MTGGRRFRGSGLSWALGWVCAAGAACAACSAGPEQLRAGQCREDRDCPGTAICLDEQQPGELARCGCRTDLMCPAALSCDPATASCRCRTDEECAPLRCDPVAWECRCRTDQDCPAPGCRCAGGLCVRQRGSDVLLCDPSATPAPDAGVARDAAGPDRGDAAATDGTSGTDGTAAMDGAAVRAHDGDGS